MTDISECIHSKKAEAIGRGLRSLSNLLRTEYKEDVQRKTHLFLPQLLKLIANSKIFTPLMKRVLWSLIGVSALGHLSE